MAHGEPSSALEKRLAASLSEGDGAFLLALATEALTAEVGAGADWARQWAKRFLARFCQTKDAAAVDPPAPELRTEFLGEIPPILGAEYASDTALLRWWEDLRSVIAAESAAHEAGLEAWLREKNPLWRLVGRVTFHLAENKGNAERPFAFLATFAEKVSATGRLQHVPLARALQMFAGSKDQAALNALLEPVRAAAERSGHIRDLLQTRQLFQPLGWTPAAAGRFLKEIGLFEECGIVVKVPDCWKVHRPARATVQITIDTKKGTSMGADAMLKFNVEAALDGTPLTAEEWEKIRSGESGLVSLRGQWVEVDREKLSQVLEHWRAVEAANREGGLSFHDGLRFLAGMPAQRGEAATAELDQAPDWTSVVAGKNLGEFLARMRDPADTPAPAGLKATLRPYQLRGFGWLTFMQRAGLGACLADDMGLGKTIQVIALLLRIREAREARNPSLLVVPASLVGNWRTEIARFAPSLRVLAAHASAMSRETLTSLSKGDDSMLDGVDAVIVTYAMLGKTPSLIDREWHLVVLDEAQAIKNPGSGQTRTVKKLQSAGRLALTGTPVENRAGDLWSLFDFLNPGLLGKVDDFAKTVARLADLPHGFAPLRRLVQPYILRRLKSDRSIIDDLPDKTEVKAQCGLTKRQALVYGRLVEELKTTLANQQMEPIRRQGLVLAFLMKFKQVCNHPSHWNGDGVWKPEDSGKFLRLAEIGAELAARQERALVFTQFQEMCDPLAAYLATVFGRPGLVLHGGTPVKKRQELVQRFQDPGGPPFFVISVKAGGTGLTLTAASHVIHFDRWWNPAVENQATDRAYRIGQKRNVLVHKFVCPGTIEERIDALIDEKKALASDLLGSGAGAEKLLTEMNNDELLDFVSLDLAAATL